MRALIVTVRTAATLIALSLLVLGCGDDDEPQRPPDAYYAARNTWSAHALGNYQFTLRQVCFCPHESPIVVTVADGKLAGATYVDTGEAVAAARQAQLPTIDGLFDLLANAYAGGADDVRVTYDGALGYPVSLRIDYDRAASDEEVGYNVSDFVH